jgi:hypothetical protein
MGSSHAPSATARIHASMHRSIIKATVESGDDDDDDEKENRNEKITCLYSEKNSIGINWLCNFWPKYEWIVYGVYISYIQKLHGVSTSKSRCAAKHGCFFWKEAHVAAGDWRNLNFFMRETPRETRKESFSWTRPVGSNSSEFKAALFMKD